ncbi:unnamed protein product [Macrosiphum euphorbiae]|uniref:Uncharacterized protein n=1 Tax=Macrosiphum euphorbiae TaxID=13131 RepID=A0AAV0XTT8_9HEMI|nr:unnamed protein product [Macrosiphum euphorbiae]
MTTLVPTDSTTMGTVHRSNALAMTELAHLVRRSRRNGVPQGAVENHGKNPNSADRDPRWISERGRT